MTACSIAAHKDTWPTTLLFCLYWLLAKNICQKYFAVLQLRGNTMNFLLLFVTVYHDHYHFQCCPKIMTQYELKQDEGKTENMPGLCMVNV